MRWWIVGWIGAMWAQSFCVAVAPQQKELARVLRQNRLAAPVRQGPLWKGLSRVTPLVADTSLTDLSHWFVLSFQGEDSAAVVQRLLQSGYFWVVEPNHRRRLCADLYGWHHAIMGTAQAWTRTMGHANVPIAIIDTGLDTALGAFTGQYWVNAPEDLNGNGRLDSADLNGLDDDGNGWIDDVIGYDFTDQARGIAAGDAWTPDPIPVDENGHGTAVTSLIAARSDRGPISGLAPGCRILVIRAFSADGYGEDDDIARGVLYAVERGVRVINCSFGDEAPSQMMHAVIRYAAARGVVVVASSGNGSGGRPHFPSSFPEVISVGAASYDPESGRPFLWPFSGYSRVDWIAPGDRIPVLLPGAQVASLSGTSLSAALTSAAIALLLSRFPGLTPEAVRATLAASAQDLGGPGWDVYTGAGLLRLLPGLDQPHEGLIQWLEPAPHTTAPLAPVALRLRIYHSLLVGWEVAQARSLQGPWLVIARGHRPAWDTSFTWQPSSEGQWYLRLSAMLRNGQAQASILPLEAVQGGLRFEQAEIGPAWREGFQGRVANYLLNASAPVCVESASDRLCADKIDTIGAIFLGIRPSTAWTFQALGGLDTPQVMRSTPPPAYEALAFDAYAIRNISAPAGFYWPYPLPDWGGDGLPDYAAAVYDEQGYFQHVVYIERRGAVYEAYDSLTARPMLIRDVRDWDADGQPDLLGVWVDSFFVCSGSPPKEIVWRGAGRAARLDANQTIWRRTENGHYERVSQQGQVLARLLDTTTWQGSTTIPRLLLLPAASETLWVFGNYSGWIFAYRGSSLVEAYPTSLWGVGSYLEAVELNGDNQSELVYLGQRPGAKLWELGILGGRPWQHIAQSVFWYEGDYAPRLFLRADTVLLWLPPYVYVGQLSMSGIRWWAYGPAAWGAFGPLREGWLLGLDSVPCVVEYTPPVLLAPAWIRVGALGVNAVDLSWSPVGSATGYELWRITGNQATLVYAGAQTDYVDTGLVAGRYAYAVRAIGGAFGEVRVVNLGPRPCLSVIDLKPHLGQVILQGNSSWWQNGESAFTLEPGNLKPLLALGSGPTWILQFAEPLQAGAYRLVIDTLLQDEDARYLDPACDTVLLIVPALPGDTCPKAITWEAVDERSIAVTFSQAPGPRAEELTSYTILPAGQVEAITRITPTRLQLQLSVSPSRVPFSLVWAWDSTCKGTIAFSPLAEKLVEWALFPNPIRRQHRAVFFGGLPPGTTVQILSADGALCTRLRKAKGETLLSWDLHTLQGERLAPGVYVVIAEYAGQRFYDKLVVLE